MEKITSDEEVLEKYVIPHLASLTNGPTGSFQVEPELLAILLGYGRANALAWGNKDAREYTKKVDAEIEAWINSRLPHKDSGYPIPNIPRFMKFPSKETEAIVNLYLKESDAIHDGWTKILHDNEELTDGSKLADHRLIVSAFLNTIFKE